MKRTVLLLLGTLLGSNSAWAVTIPVIDLDGIRQLVTSYRSQLQSYATQLQQYQNQIQQLQQLLTTVQQGRTNLQALRVPTNMNDVIGLLTQLDGQLASAQRIGYKVNQAQQQAEDLYATLQGRPTAAQQRELYRRFVAAQREAAALAVKAQAIEEQNTKTQALWERVQVQQAAAAGNMEINQANGQALVLIGTELTAIKTQSAIAQREQSLRNLEEAARSDLELNAVEATGKSLDVSTFVPDGKSLSLTTGREK